MSAKQSQQADASQEFQTAVQLYQRGRFDQAATLCKAILAKEPGVANALHLLAALHSHQGRNKEAADCLYAVLKLQPANLAALSDLGGVYARLGKPAEALATFDKVLAQQPRQVETLNSRGTALLSLKRAGDALASYDKALALRPNYVEALHNRGNALTELKRNAEALEAYDRALSLRPDLPDGHYNRGNALRELKRPAEALASYDKALALRPNYADALNNRGNALRELERFTDALASYDKVLVLRHDDAEALNNRGNALRELKRHSEAIESYDRALALKTTYVEAHDNKGLALTELGHMDKARACFETAIALDPKRPATYFNLSGCKRFAPGDPQLQAMVELARNMEAFSADDTIALHFALGKAYADAADPQRSFDHLLAGNALKRSQLAYNEDLTVGILQGTQAVFTPELLRAKAGHGDPSTLPIFILGMPRSGSTLIEQILASHLQVVALGEVDDFAKAVSNISKGLESPEGFAQLSGAQVRQIGQTYVAGIKAFAPVAARISDKMLENFRFIGLIHLALPNARIIHMRRDPFDICISCFSKLFAGDNLPFTYNLAELGRYYKAYESLMAHWRNVLPPDAMLDVQYEEVVADLEGQARRILNYCGLEWDASCLDFHKTERPVRTASKAQVREPLFKSSVGRWRDYEPYLGPLLEALADNERQPFL